jgi:hypothetical protein
VPLGDEIEDLAIAAADEAHVPFEFEEKVGVAALDLVVLVPWGIAGADDGVGVKIIDRFPQAVHDEPIVIPGVDGVPAPDEMEGAHDIDFKPAIGGAPEVFDRHAVTDELLDQRRGIVRRSVVRDDDFIGEGKIDGFAIVLQRAAQKADRL